MKRTNTTGSRSKLSEMDFYSYRKQARREGFNVIIRVRRLFQMYLVDQWVKVETHRLEWARHHQQQLKYALYSVVLDALHQDDCNDEYINYKIILLPSIQGSNHF